MACNILTINQFSLVRDERGSLALEVALCVPFLLLLLFGGVSLIQMVHFSRTVERTAALLADSIAQEAVLHDATIDAAADAAAQILNARGEVAAFTLNLAAYRQDTAGTAALWARKRGAGTVTCNQPPRLPANAAGESAGAGVLYILEVSLCAMPGSGVYIAPMLAVSGYQAAAQKLSIARRAAIRSLE